MTIRFLGPLVSGFYPVYMIPICETPLNKTTSRPKLVFSNSFFLFFFSYPYVFLTLTDFVDVAEFT